MNTTDDHGGGMKAVERATRAELHTLPGPARSSALAAAAVVLAKRLDGEPGDAVASMLVRELRHAMEARHRRDPEGVTDDVERFLERIAAPDLGHAAG
jgi:uncharacterized protein (DUF2267 family)